MQYPEQCRGLDGALHEEMWASPAHLYVVTAVDICFTVMCAHAPVHLPISGARVFPLCSLRLFKFLWSHQIFTIHACRSIPELSLEEDGEKTHTCARSKLRSKLSKYYYRQLQRASGPWCRGGRDHLVRTVAWPHGPPTEFMSIRHHTLSDRQSRLVNST